MAPKLIAHFRAPTETQQLDSKIYFEDHKTLIVENRKFTFDALLLPPSSLSQWAEDIQFMAPIMRVFAAASPPPDPTKTKTVTSNTPTVLYYGDDTKATAELVTTIFAALEDAVGNLDLHVTVSGTYVGAPDAQVTFVENLEVPSWFEAMMIAHDCLKAHLKVYDSMTSVRAGRAMAIKINAGTRSLMILDLNYVPPLFPAVVQGSTIVTSQEKRLGLKSRILLPQSVAQSYSLIHIVLDCPLDETQHHSMRDALEFGFQLQRHIKGNLLEDSEEEVDED